MTPSFHAQIASATSRNSLSLLFFQHRLPFQTTISDNTSFPMFRPLLLLVAFLPLSACSSISSKNKREYNAINRAYEKGKISRAEQNRRLYAQGQNTAWELAVALQSGKRLSNEEVATYNAGIAYEITPYPRRPIGGKWDVPGVLQFEAPITDEFGGILIDEPRKATSRNASKPSSRQVRNASVQASAQPSFWARFAESFRKSWSVPPLSEMPAGMASGYGGGDSASDYDSSSSHSTRSAYYAAPTYSGTSSYDTAPSNSRKPVYFSQPQLEENRRVNYYSSNGLMGQQIGNNYHRADGVMIQKVGDNYHTSDGLMIQKVGDQYLRSDGLRIQKVGDHYMRSDGVTIQKVGNNYYTSDGRMIQTMGAP